VSAVDLWHVDRNCGVGFLPKQVIVEVRPWEWDQLSQRFQMIDERVSANASLAEVKKEQPGGEPRKTLKGC